MGAIRVPLVTSPASVLNDASSRVRRVRALDLLLWASPLVTLAYLYEEQRQPLLPGHELAIALIVAIGVVVYASNHAAVALALVALVPFQTVVFSLLYRIGMPTVVLRDLSSWKEALVIALVLAAVRVVKEAPPKLDRIDLIAIVYIAMVALYAFGPHWLVPSTGLDSSGRLGEFRANALFIIAFLAARHARIPFAAVRRMSHFLFGAAVVTSAVAMFEFAFPSTWNDFVVNQLEFPRYAADVLKTPLADPTDLRLYAVVAGQQLLRVGSVLFNPITMSFALLAGFAVGCQRVISGRARTGTFIALTITAMAILLSQTRSAAIGLVVIALVPLRAWQRKDASTVARFQLLMVAAAVVLVPLALWTGVAGRVTGAITGSEQSSIEHRNSLSTSLDRLWHHPLGEGLGVANATRFQVEDVAVAENYYLQVGNETGVAAMGLFIALTIATISQLRRLAESTDETGVSALYPAALGLAVAGMFLHVWLTLEVALPFWAAAGAAIGAAERTADDDSASVETVVEQRR